MIQYSLTERGNPNKPEAPKKWYPQAVATSEITFKELAKDIATTSTVSDTDVLAVLNDLNKIASKYLAYGFIVRLGDLGSLQVGIFGEGAASKEQFSTSMITGSKIYFRPGTDLKIMLQNLKYKKAFSDKLGSEPTATPEEEI